MSGLHCGWLVAVRTREGAGTAAEAWRWSLAALTAASALLRALQQNMRDIIAGVQCQ